MNDDFEPAGSGADEADGAIGRGGVAGILAALVIVAAGVVLLVRPWTTPPAPPVAGGASDLAGAPADPVASAEARARSRAQLEARLIALPTEPLTAAADVLLLARMAGMPRVIEPGAAGLAALPVNERAAALARHAKLAAGLRALADRTLDEADDLSDAERPADALDLLRQVRDLLAANAQADGSPAAAPVVALALRRIRAAIGDDSDAASAADPAAIFREPGGAG